MMACSRKKSVIIFIFIIFIAVFLHPSNANAQLLNKVMGKLEKAFVTGDFKQINKQYKALRSKVKKKALSVQDSLEYLYAESRYHRLKGSFKISEELAAAYLHKAESKLGANSSSYLEFLLRKATVSLEAGDYIPCRKVIDRFFEANHQYASADSDLVFKARLIQTKNAIESGAIGEANLLIEKLLFKAENRLRERKEENDGNGRVRYKKLSSNETEKRNHDLLMVKVLKTRILRERGELGEALAVLQEIKSFVKENDVMGEDRASIEYHFESARCSMASGEKEKTIEELKEALSWFSRSDYELGYERTHDQYINILEILILTYHLNGDRTRAKDFTRIHREILESRFPEAPSFILRKNMPLGENWDYKTIEKSVELERMLREAETYSLPWRYSERILSNLTEAYFQSDSLEKAEQYLLKHAQFLKEKLGSNSVFYHVKNCELAEFYFLHSTKSEKAATLFRQSLQGGLVPQLAETSDLLLRAWNQEGLYFEMTDKFQQCLNNYIRVLNILETKRGKNSFEAVVQSMRVAGAEIQTGEYKAAEDKYLNALDVLSKADKPKEKMECEQLLARLYIITGRYKEADRFLIRALKTRKAKTDQAILSFNGMDEEIMLMMQKGLFTEAQQRSEEIIRQRMVRLRTRQHRSLILPYQISAEVYSVNGHYGQAENYAVQACEISKAVYGDSSMHYFRSLTILARVHSSYGDYERALELARQAIDGISRFYGSDYIEMAQPLTDLAMVLLNKGGSKEDALQFLNRANAIVESRFGQKHPRYAESLQYLAAFYLQANKMQDALPLLDQAEKIWKEKLGKSNMHLAEILLARAEIDLKFGRIGSARNYMKDAAELYEGLFNDLHPKYVSILPRIAQTYYLENNQEKALDYCRDANRQSLAFVRKFFPSMSDREKARLWTGLQSGFEFFYTLVLNNQAKKPELIHEMYDVVLQTKAILLSSSVRVRERILNNANPDIKLKYQNWMQKKEEISAAVEMGPDNRADAGINLGKLESEADDLEASLGRNSEDFKISRDEAKLTWKQVKSSLPPGTAAVEMVRFRYFEKGFTDSVIYMALIIKEENKGGPVSVLFPDGKKMESRFIKYYRNSVKMGSKDDVSYGIFWAPIKAVLTTTSRVYFAPDGVYNELNPEGLLTPSGAYIIDDVRLTLVSTTRDILGEKKVRIRPAGQNNLALILGDPQYYAPDFNGDKQIEQLPGTRAEIEKLSSVLKANRWEVITLTDTGASERRIKSVGNPRVLHIATHGFFKENPGAGLPESSFSLLNRNRAVDNPLLRSGLYLKSAGITLEQSEGKNQFQLGEGIMSALEAMNLSLAGSELVVLSACETGRGDLKAGEGVYGLQRAFQIAGAKAIIMSLFKVSDEATQELMEIFYKNWIERGMTIREAFYQAKQELKKTRQEPLLWASFVLVGG